MRVEKKIINMSTGAHILCAWDTCSRDGVQLHTARVKEPTGVAVYPFCSERHRQYWINSHRRLGQLPPGYRLAIT